MRARYRLRTKSSDGTSPGAISLDVLDSDDANITAGWKPRADTPTTKAASDLLWLAEGALAADVLTLRSEAPDGWTRDVALRLNVASASWSGREAEAAALLRFLTGDRWTVEFVKRAGRVQSVPATDVRFDAVCLLSGGLDSLIGAIDLLDEDGNRRVLLVGAQDSTLSARRQTLLSEALQNAYPGRVALRQATFRPLKPGDRQRSPLSTAREQTTRSRSIFFIAAGLACAASVGAEVPLYVPENGLIGINVPLVPARAGSLSTRTMHPEFLGRLGRLGAAVGVGNPVINPLRMRTKGEAAASCRNQTLLADTARTSISCAHPTVGRFNHESGPCGYCYPCLIRRASLHCVGLDRGDDYRVDVLADGDFLESASSRPASLRAVIAAIFRGTAPSDVLRNGPVAPAEAEQLAVLHTRGLAELEKWLRTATAKAVIDALP